jgi:hypothetical protein
LSWCGRFVAEAFFQLKWACFGEWTGWSNAINEWMHCVLMVLTSYLFLPQSTSNVVKPKVVQ